MKRLIAGLLCTAMMISLIPFEAFADTGTTGNDTVNIAEEILINDTQGNTTDSTGTQSGGENSADSVLVLSESEESGGLTEAAGIISSAAGENTASTDTAATGNDSAAATTTGTTEDSATAASIGETDDPTDVVVTVSGEDAASEGDATSSSDTGIQSDELAEGSGGQGKQLYLSDIAPHRLLRCSVGWGTYTKDKNLDGKTIKLKTGANEYKEFDKGITAHADADLIYDLQYTDYDYFETYIGVDAYRGTNGQVKFKIYLARPKEEGESSLTWEEQTTDCDGNTFTWLDQAFKGNTIAQFVKINVSGYRYLRVVIDKDGTDAADHSTLAGARVYTTDYVRPTITNIKDASYYLDYIDGKTYSEILSDQSLELKLLQYRFMKLCGKSELEYALTATDNYTEAIKAYNWLFNDYTALKEFLNGGIPQNSNYIGAVGVLGELYAAYAEDMENTEALKSPDADHTSDTKGDLYRRMMLTMSLVCADGMTSWMARTGYVNPVNRYAYFKENYTSDKMRDEIFENLGVDEMRWVLGNNVSDAEIVWLNDYARAHPRNSSSTGYPIIYSPHHHIKYQWYNYDKDIFYAEENEETYRTRYMLDEKYEKYGLTYGLTDGLKVQRIWMVFEDGAVCGNISRTGANLAASFGVPACEVGQPGHAAFAKMDLSNGKMVWGIDNDISGWTQSSNSRRMPADWGNVSDSWSSGLKAQYLLLSQAALDDLPNYSKAEEIMMLYDLATTFEEREACCRAALEYMPFHLDAWLALVQLYTGDSGKTATDLTELAEELCSKSTKLYLYPKATYDLMNLITTRLKAMQTAETDEDNKLLIEAEIARCNMILQAAYKRATEATTEDCSQPAVSRSIANTFLASGTYTLCTFSFDGDNAGKLVFDSGFTGVRFRYCLNYTDDDTDNEIWSDSISIYAENGKACAYALSSEEIASITAENDILIWIDGWPGNDGNPIAANAYKIDITSGTAATGLDFNDNENRFMGNVSACEYSVDGGTVWETLTNETVFEGSSTIIVHRKATGTTLKGADYTYTSTNDNTTDRAYIPISRLTLAAYSSEETSKNDYAKYAIDGLITTRWHTLWNGSDKQKYITIKTDEPTYFSGIDYTPVGGNGTITAGQIYVSTDGENWIPAATITGWADNSNRKSISFTPVYGQYLKIAVTDSHGGFVSARKIELFEDLTAKEKEIIGVTLITLPTKRDYVRGEKLDLAGARVRLVYKDNTYAILPTEMLTVNTTVLNTTGTIEIRLAYGSFAPIRFHVNVTEREFTPTSITILHRPDKTEYYAGDTIDGYGMEVSATDGTTTVYLTEDEYELSADTENTGNCIVTVTMKGTTLTDTFEVYIKQAISSLEITGQPTRLTYELGDALDTAGLEVTAVYADGIKEVLSSDRYVIINAGTFSEEEGNLALTVALADRESVQTCFYVTVFPYFTKDGIRYSADVKTGTCYVMSVSTESEFVTIPESVKLGLRTYTVTGIGSNVLTNSSTVKEVSLPGSITNIAENAFSNCTALDKVYLTAHTGFDNLTVADNSFNTDVEIVLYAATEKLENELKEQSYAQDVGVGNISGQIASISVTPPDVTTVSRGQTPDFTGYSVYAVLNDGTRVPLDKSTCTTPSVDTSTAGEKKVTITLTGTELSDYFTITVRESTIYIKENPEGALYTSLTAAVTPLKVVAVSDNSNDVFEYQWYRSDTGTPDYSADRIDGATQATYIPDKTGLYYAGVSIKGTEICVYSLQARVSIGDYVAISGNEGYDSLAAAINDVSDGATVELLKDVTLSSGITLGKSLTLLGNDHTVTRGKGFTGNMFTVTGGTLTVYDLILDGGAGWTGTVNEQLQRGCESSGTVAYGTIIRSSGSAKLVLENTTLKNNYNMSTQTKSTTGGAIYAENYVEITLTDVSITDNYSYLFGSAIYHRDNTVLTINEGCYFHGNSGSDKYNTSVICVDNNGVCTVNGGTFCHNVGMAKGGVFWVSNGSLTINGGTFTDNVSTAGKTLYLNGSATVTLNGYDKIEEIYLPSGKTITIGGELPEGSLVITTDSTTEKQEIIKLKEGVDPLAIQDAVTINGKAAGKNSSGNLTIACSAHTESNWIVREEATCSKEGTEYTCCTECGAQISTRSIACTDHTWECVAEVPAGCTATGTTAGVWCSVCHEVQSGMETIPAHGHSYQVDFPKTATCTEEGEIRYTCTYCGDTYSYTKDMLGHDMAVTVKTEPTYLHVGYETHTCTRCGETYDVEIPALTAILGDINMDGEMNMKDVVRLMKYQLGETTAVNTNILDVNGDNSENIKDIVRLLRVNSGEEIEIFR